MEKEYTGSKFKKFKNRQKLFLICGLYGMAGSTLAVLIFSILSKFVFQNKSVTTNIIFGVVMTIIVVIFLISVFCVRYGIKQYKKEYYFRKLNNKIVCKMCGDEVSQNEEFCDNCGIKVIKSLVEKGVAESETCVACGKLNFKNKNYCKQCGTKINKGQ